MQLQAFLMGEKMSGKNKIGRRLERLVAAMLKEAGWTVRIVEPSIKYLARQKTYISRPQDIFGADIVCLRKDSPVLFVQVTAHPGVKKRIEEFTKYPFPFPMAIVLILQARKDKNKWRFKVGRYIDGEFYWAGRMFLSAIFGRVYSENPDRFLPAKGEY